MVGVLRSWLFFAFALRAATSLHGRMFRPEPAPAPLTSPGQLSRNKFRSGPEVLWGGGDGPCDLCDHLTGRTRRQGGPPLQRDSTNLIWCEIEQLNKDKHPPPRGRDHPHSMIFFDPRHVPKRLLLVFWGEIRPHPKAPPVQSTMGQQYRPPWGCAGASAGSDTPSHPALPALVLRGQPQRAHPEPLRKGPGAARGLGQEGLSVYLRACHILYPLPQIYNSPSYFHTDLSCNVCNYIFT